jgi:hypothetical protein
MTNFGNILRLSEEKIRIRLPFFDKPKSGLL